MRRACRFLPALLGISLIAALANGAEPTTAKDLTSGLESLFDAGWRRSVQARAEAQQRYEELRRLAPGDVRVAYAYALVQLRQLRYADAAKLLGEVLRGDKKHLSAWKAKAWLSMITKEYGAALGDMQRVADLLPAETAVTEQESPYRQAADFLGRMIGYLEGPAAESVDAGQLAECRQQILARLSPARQAIFNAARRAVVEQYAGGAEEADQASAAAEESAAKQKDRMVQDLDRKAQDVTAQTAEEQKRLQDLAKQLAYELEKLAAEERSVLDRGRQIEIQVAGVRRELQVIDVRIAELLSLAQQTDNAQERQRFLDDAARWQVRRQRPLAALADLNRQYAALTAQRVALVQRQQEFRNQYQREAGRIDRLQASLDRLRRDKAKVQGQPVTGNTPKVRDQRKRNISLTTYVPLPLSLESERDGLLESLVP